ncbi:hypothetical protein [Actinoplanes sp. RD1]|uniref:hypothetical protein n=1 Tax=Actinoplanes sp. RD1 TaxID=3064538 RepID=UPI0027408DF8|nr:hypothetical protein [Actinoplanes sp. RD1]
MTDHEEQLREAFGTRENDTPDPAAVYARVQELSQTYKRRRRGAQFAGGAVLGAGLIVGAFQVPALFTNPSAGNDITMVAPAAPSAAPSPSPSGPSDKALGAIRAAKQNAEDAPRLDAYFAAGYDYDDAVQLAKIWKIKHGDDLTAVKAKAGQELLDGKKLPVQLSASEKAQAKENAAYDAFFNAGYDYDDAEKFAQLWKIDDPSDAKVAAGKKLLAGEELPIKATPVEQQSELETKQVNAFFAGGYSMDDAAELAEIWKLPTPYDAKVAGGEKLLAGQALPIDPQ